MRCDNCDGAPVYNRRYSGQKFCHDHFTEYFERKVKKTINDSGMIKRGERIGVALSGGKDSITLLSILNKMEDIELFAIAVDEGIKGYREKSLHVAKKFCKETDISLEIISFKNSFGVTVDETKDHACSFCGVLRRRLLNDRAKELGLDKLATGHNLDDETQAIMINYIRGDPERLLRLSNSTHSDKFVPRIKPLQEMPEKEVGLYAVLNFNIDFSECPYAGDSFRTGIRDFINTLERDNPGIKFSIKRGYEKLTPYLESYPTKELKECPLCGEPTSGEVCKVCDMLQSTKMFINDNKNRRE
ncbi:TIGR00269 family protein [archaeon]|nr:TIGR00269 family protein [archaeon]